MYKEIAANKRRTILMMVVFILLVSVMGWIFSEFLGKPAITPLVLVGALVYVLISYFSGSRMALSVNGAKEIQKSDNPRLWRTVENLAITEGLPMPRVFIIEDPAPNAFATGRDPKHAAVCATSGLLDIMNDTELEGVFAHELGHVKNYDIRVAMIVFALVAVVSLLADVILRATFLSDSDDDNSGWVFILGIVAALLAPLIAWMIQLSISRKREYLADATGALTTRYPEGLVNALEKLQATSTAMQKQSSSTAHLFFANPLKASGISKFFSTHPPLDDRIARLKAMENNG